MIGRCLRSFLTIAAAAALIGGCHVETNGNELEGGNVDQSKSSWSIGTRSDPMNDDTIYSAVGRIQSGEYTLQVEVVCRNSNKLTYNFSTFEENKGIPIKFKILTIPNIFSEIPSLRRVAKIGVRLDDLTEEQWEDVDPDYSNEFTVSNVNNIDTLLDGQKINGDVSDGKASDYSLFASRMQRANSVALRFPLLDGTVTFQLDQTDPDLRSVLDRCPGQSGDMPESPTLVRTGGESNTTAEPDDEKTEAGPISPEFSALGIKVDMDYAAAKSILLSNGFRPGGGFDDPCSSIGEEQCKPYPEIESCSGTGQGYCLSIFIKGDRKVEVTTFGPGGPIAIM